MTIQIDKSVPMPDVSPTRKYPFPNMLVGDSFFSEDKRVSSAAHNWGKVNGVKFVTRAENGGIRIWRFS